MNPFLHVGQDGWLFLTGGSNQVLGLFDAASDQNLRDWAELIGRRIARSTALGARYLQVVVPDKLTVYNDRVSAPIADISLAPGARLRAMLDRTGRGDAWVDVVTPMSAVKDGTDLYWRTDTHWTFAGCRCAYEELCRVIGVAPATHIGASAFHETETALDLGSKAEPPQREVYREYRIVRDAERIFANDLVELKESTGRHNEYGLHVGSHVIYANRTAAAHPQRIVLFGDSYSDWRAHMLTAMLAETFREVHFVWSAAIDWRYVEAVRPDYVIAEVAERFLRKCPRDDFDVAAYAAARVKRAVGQPGLAGLTARARDALWGDAALPRRAVRALARAVGLSR